MCLQNFFLSENFFCNGIKVVCLRNIVVAFIHVLTTESPLDCLYKPFYILISLSFPTKLLSLLQQLRICYLPLNLYYTLIYLLKSQAYNVYIIPYYFFLTFIVFLYLLTFFIVLIVFVSLLFFLWHVNSCVSFNARSRFN